MPQFLCDGFHSPKVGGDQEGHILGTCHVAPGAQEEPPGGVAGLRGSLVVNRWPMVCPLRCMGGLVVHPRVVEGV